MNVTALYWGIFRRWRHLRCAGGVESLDEGADETVLLEKAGQRISFIQAYPHRGTLLRDLSFYDYMSVVKLKRKGKVAAAREEVEFDCAWSLSQTWVQVLRNPGKEAIVVNISFRWICYYGLRGSRVAQRTDSVDLGQPHNILLFLFHGNHFCQRHRAISTPSGRGKSKPYLGGYHAS